MDDHKDDDHVEETDQKIKAAPKAKTVLPTEEDDEVDYVDPFEDMTPEERAKKQE